MKIAVHKNLAKCNIDLKYQQKVSIWVLCGETLNSCDNRNSINYKQCTVRSEDGSHRKPQNIACFPQKPIGSKIGG